MLWRNKILAFQTATILFGSSRKLILHCTPEFWAEDINTPNLLRGEEDRNALGNYYLAADKSWKIVSEPHRFAFFIFLTFETGR